MRAPSFIAILAASACGARGGQPAPVGNVAPVAARACIADRMAEPPPTPAPRIQCAGDEANCRVACTEGEAAACVSLGYTVDEATPGSAEAAALYGRGCELGDLNGCTNYGAYLIDGIGGLTADPACAARLHQRACAGGDAYGCGMFGRELAHGVGIERDVARARSLLETSCAELGSFACHALGMVRESGDLGEVDLAGAASAFQRSCDSGTVESCDDVERLAGPR